MNEMLQSSSEADKSPVLKALRVLSLVAERGEPVGLADLARSLGLPKPTSYRLAACLEAAGFLHKDAFTKRYLIGPRFEGLALSALRNGASHSSRRIMLDQLAERIGARINLAVVKSGKLLFVEWVESSAPLRIDLKPETNIPVHCSASGKLLAAFGPAELREAFLKAAPYAQLTKKTIVSAKAMARELEEIKRRGYAEDNEEFLPGVNCLAVPIRNARGEVVAGLAAMAPMISAPLSNLRRFIPDLTECAERIAAEFSSQRSARAATSGTAKQSQQKSKGMKRDQGGLRMTRD